MEAKTAAARACATQTDPGRRRLELCAHRSHGMHLCYVGSDAFTGGHTHASNIQKFACVCMREYVRAHRRSCGWCAVHIYHVQFGGDAKSRDFKYVHWKLESDSGFLGLGSSEPKAEVERWEAIRAGFALYAIHY